MPMVLNIVYKDDYITISNTMLLLDNRFINFIGYLPFFPIGYSNLTCSLIKYIIFLLKLRHSQYFISFSRRTLGGTLEANCSLQSAVATILI